MSNRTCCFGDCETSLVRKSGRGRWPKYCDAHRDAARSAQRRDRGPDSRTQFCSVDDCGRPMRAKGMCDMHYKRQARAEGRWNEKKIVGCVVCGTTVERSTGGGRRYGNTCSNACRWSLNGGPAPRTRLPDDHWVRWIGKTSEWPKAGWKTCGWCAMDFPAAQKSQMYCSIICSEDASYDRTKQRNGWGEYNLIAKLDRGCQRCGKTYRHRFESRIHCSDLCRDLDADDRRKQRGTYLFHGWISPAVRESIYIRDDYMCWLCGESVDLNDDRKYGDWSPSLDHVIPRSRGGSHDPENLKTAHRWCNSVRSDNDPLEFFPDALV